MPPKSNEMAMDKHVNIHELTLDYNVLSPPEAETPPTSNEMATDKHMNIHELILDYMCCHHQKLKCPLSQTKRRRINT